MAQEYDYSEYDSLLDDLSNTHKYKMIYQFINSGYLTKNERYVLARRLNLYQNEVPPTLQVLAFALGISSERVRQIEYKAMRKLRKWNSLVVYKDRW